MDEYTVLGFDAGSGALKLWGAAGGLQLPAQIAVNGNTGKTVKMMGLGARKPPLNIRTAVGSFWVGVGAHDWGRPVENLDYDRLTGAPELVALFYGCVTRYVQQYGSVTAPIHATVGLPLEPMTGEASIVAANVASVRKWMLGSHEWEADGRMYHIEIADVKLTSQPVGALFDYLMDEQGKFVPERRSAFKKEVGIISVGFNTVELLVVRDKAPVQRFTGGTTAGVRRLLEIVNSQRLYSLGELDAQLRAGRLDTSDALPVWAREVTGAIEKQWGTYWRRFAAVLLVGGGVVLLKDILPDRFGGKAFMPDDPVLSIARGLYKLMVSQSKRRSDG